MCLAQMLSEMVASLEGVGSLILLATRARIPFSRLVELAVAGQRVLARKKSIAYSADERLVLRFLRVIFHLTSP